jgi:hypothetical protein
MDDYTNYCWIFLLPHKDDLPQVMLQWLRQVTSQYKIKVKCFRCDNAGENKSFQSLLKRNGNTILSLSIQHPVHLNKMVKLNVNCFATLYRKFQSVLNAAGFPAFLRSRLWSYAANCVTQLENTIVDSSTLTAFENILDIIQNGLRTYVLLVRLV